VQAPPAPADDDAPANTAAPDDARLQALQRALDDEKREHAQTRAALARADENLTDLRDALRMLGAGPANAAANTERPAPADDDAPANAPRSWLSKMRRRK
jgi:hypothetical protein